MVVTTIRLFGSNPLQPDLPQRLGSIDIVHRPLDPAAARAALQAAFDAGLRAIAIVLLHGYRFTAHEAVLAAIAADIPKWAKVIKEANIKTGK